WHSDDHLIVGLFVPSTLDWNEKMIGFELETGYPNDGAVTLKVVKAAKPTNLSISIRVPAWAGAPQLKLNGKPQKLAPENGYASIRRKWRTGDAITMTLQMKPRIEIGRASCRERV